MANMDPFNSALIQYVRNEMPDDAILELVRNKLVPEGDEAAEAAPAPAPKRSSRPSKAKRSKAKKTSTKKATTKKASKKASTKKATTKKAAKKKSSKARRGTKDRSADLQTVESVVKGAKGLSASEIAKKAKMPQSRVSTLVRALKSEGRIFQGGDRRFARYAGDAKTAAAASEHARKNASGPKR